MVTPPRRLKSSTFPSFVNIGNSLGGFLYYRVLILSVVISHFLILLYCMCGQSARWVTLI
jgi:hypothetical protein